MNNDLLNALEQISKITFSISDLYDLILYTEINKDYLENYNEDLDKYIKRLLLLKDEEDELYNYFNDNFVLTHEALQIINNPNNKLNEKETLCVIRIAKRLYRIYASCLTEIPELIDENVVDEKVIEYLEGLDYDETDSKIIAIEIAPLIEKSLATTIHNLTYDELKNIKNEYIRTTYIRRMFKQAFGIGSSFEYTFIDKRFTIIEGNLNEELNTLIKDKNIKNHLISLSIRSSLNEILVKFINEKDPGLLDELFIQFKAYLLHLERNDLIQYLTIIYTLSRNHSFNYEPLIDEINRLLYQKNKEDMSKQM